MNPDVSIGRAVARSEIAVDKEAPLLEIELMEIANGCLARLSGDLVSETRAALWSIEPMLANEARVALDVSGVTYHRRVGSRGCAQAHARRTYFWWNGDVGRRSIVMCIGCSTADLDTERRVARGTGAARRSSCGGRSSPASAVTATVAGRRSRLGPPSRA